MAAWTPTPGSNPTSNRTSTASCWPASPRTSGWRRPPARRPGGSRGTATSPRRRAPPSTSPTTTRRGCSPSAPPSDASCWPAGTPGRTCTCSARARWAWTSRSRPPTGTSWPRSPWRCSRCPTPPTPITGRPGAPDGDEFRAPQRSVLRRKATPGGTVRTLAITQNTTVDGAVEMLDDWFSPQGQEGVDDSDLVEEIHRQDERADALLLGRQTFEDFRSYWPGRTDDPTGISAYLDRVQKYVVSSTLTEPGWQHTTVLDGDPVERVRELKQQQGADIVVTGSITLCHTLIDAGLVDEYRLFTYPAVQGRGRRLFPDGRAGLVDGGLRRRGHRAHGEEAVDQPVEPADPGLHPRGAQRLAVGLALVAERVVLRGDDRRRQQPGEVGGVQWGEPRVLGVVPRAGVVAVE